MAKPSGNDVGDHSVATGEHAIRLIIENDVAAKKKGCPTLSITCKPKMLSCEPVAHCRNFNHGGCSPLECSPVATKPSS